jgi:hypothetical protein
MFDKTFLKFAIGFVAIIFLGVGTLYLVGQYRADSSGYEAAAVR